MKNQNNSRIPLLFTILFLYAFSCMDPVLDTDESYSDFEAFDASDYLNDPNEGFLNGGFEDGDVSLWGGFKFQFNEDVQTNVTLEVQKASYTSDSIMVSAPVEGEYYLRLELESGRSGLYRYFAYSPGDTLEYSFSYMIPSGQKNTNDPGFNLGVALTATDADANFLEQEVFFWDIDGALPSYRLFADDEWHDVTISFSNSSLEAVGNYFQVFFNEWSHFSWAYDSVRAFTAYFDNFNVELKKSKNIKPTDFSILHPVTGDAFNLDTITNFQTIPFSWEESIDLDTVLYTNKLICKVVCDGASISNGFESFTMHEQWDPVAEQTVFRKMPSGYGGLSFNWQSDQTENLNFGWQYINNSVVDSVSRTGSHSLSMEDVAEIDYPYFYSTLIYRLSQVNDFVNKDRIKPGTELTVKGYAMTPTSDKLTGENHAELVIFSYTDIWNISISEQLNSSSEAGIWHPFEVSIVVPESRVWPNTSTVYVGFRYSQFGSDSGKVYFDDITVTTSEPITFFVTDYYDVITSNTSTIMSATYLKNLFSYIIGDLSGVSFSEVKFEWGILATDLKDEVKALNSPITFTVIDTTFENNNESLLKSIPYLSVSNKNNSFNLFGAR